MASPSARTQNLSDRYTNYRILTGRIKDECDAIAAASTYNLIQALSMRNNLFTVIGQLQTITQNAVADGLVAYAQNVEGKPALDLVAEYQAMLTQLVSVRDWIFNNFPAKDANGNPVPFTWNINAPHANVNLTPAQLTAFKNQIAALGATIEG